MPEFISFGETMGVFAQSEKMSLRYCKDFKLRIAGAESNTAIGVSKLGITSGWMSRLGDDEIGAFVLNSIRSEGVDVSRVILDSEHQTGVMIKEIKASDTSVYYYRKGSAASNFSVSDIDFDYLKSARIVHLTGITPILSNSCLEAVMEVVDFCKNNGISLSFDPNIRMKLWQNTDYSDIICKIMYNSKIVMLGLSEAEILLRTNDPRKIADKILSCGAEYIAIKNGDRGAWCADKSEFLSISPELCTPVDSVGAGDGFNAGFVSGILKGESLAVCGKMGAIAGAMATETNGDTEGYPTEREMETRLLGKATVQR